MSQPSDQLTTSNWPLQGVAFAPLGKGLKMIPGIALLLAIGLLGKAAAAHVPHMEYVIFAIAFGALISNTVPIPRVFVPGIRTYEFWLKVGENVGHEQASDLMERVKEELVGQKFTDKTAIIDLIRKSALEIGIELSPADVQQIADLMAKINSLDLKQNDLQIQLDKMSGRVDRLLGTQMGLKDTITSWFQRLVDLIARLLDQFMSFVAGARP